MSARDYTRVSLTQTTSAKTGQPTMDDASTMFVAALAVGIGIPVVGKLYGLSARQPEHVRRRNSYAAQLPKAWLR